ncbi:unnamed protein product [Brassica rapa]|uniref:Uncharacterized protein n=2 Tax=Brassica TaxID=3705 RepID=A0A8D9HDZ6_BRACM|nr:unnamed protein product [Brassica napus]CAG7897750.1 unnamed protein product [Brassica rapa]
MCRFLWCPFVLDSSPSMRYKFHCFNVIKEILTIQYTEPRSMDLTGTFRSRSGGVGLFRDLLSFQAAADRLDISPPPLHYFWTLIFPSNSAILDRAVSFSVIANKLDLSNFRVSTKEQAYGEFSEALIILSETKR